MNKITEGTLVPVSLMVLFSGFVYWLSSLYALAAENRNQIASIHVQIDSIEEEMANRRTQLWTAIRDQDRRLANIEGKLDALIELQKREKGIK